MVGITSSIVFTKLGTYELLSQMHGICFTQVMADKWNECVTSLHKILNGNESIFHHKCSSWGMVDKEVFQQEGGPSPECNFLAGWSRKNPCRV